MVLEPQEELMKKFQSVPEIQVIEKYIPIEESDIPTSLVGVDTISIKHALLIDCQENDMLRTFDNLEIAINKLYEKIPNLLSILEAEYGLEPMSSENWEQYRNNCIEYINTCIANNDDSYSGIATEYNILELFFDIYENTEQNMDLINRINSSKLRMNNPSITVGQLVTQLPANTPLAKEINEIRKEEKINQIQELSSKSQTRGSSVSKYFNINLGIKYAIEHATNPNLLKYEYLNGKDCTNFASQILYEGGLPMSWEGDGWWHQSGRYHYYSTSWINANAFCYWFGNDYITESLYDLSGVVRVGDFIAIDTGRDWSYDHVGFVTILGTYDWHTNNWGHNQYYRDFMVAQHTNDYHLWVSDKNNGWDDVEGQDTEATRTGRYIRLWTR